MKYNFDEIHSRRNTHSIKWDAAESNDILPMWIADMDFKTFPPITEALVRIAEQGHYGYNTVPVEFYDAIIFWWNKRHKVLIPQNWILPSTGVVAGISAAITVLSEPGDEIIIQAPASSQFFDIIHASRCKTVVNELIYEDGHYQIDFDDLELKAASANAKILLLCNPHNPVGRVWTKQELDKVASICSRHHIFVISDEIHSDLVFTGQEHIPFITIAAEHDLPYVVCSSPSKMFNLSGLHAAYLFVNNSNLRSKIEKQLWAQTAGMPSLMACKALTVSYTQGEEWLTQLNVYLYENYKFLKKFIATHLSKISVLPLEATYLVWLDCKKMDKKSNDLSELLLEKGKLLVNAGDMYGPSGEGFLRLNIACPREVLQEGLTRFKNVVEDF